MDIKQSIINTANELFEKISYSKTSVSDIANACNIGKGTVYLYFKSKDEIIATIIHQRIAAAIKNFEAKYSNKEIPFDEMITQYNLIVLETIIEIRDLLFGSFENLKANVIRDVFNLVERSKGLTIDFIHDLVIKKDCKTQKDTNTLKAHIEEYFYVIVGRIILYFFKTDWDNIDPLKQIIKDISYKTFVSIALQ